MFPVLDSYPDRVGVYQLVKDRRPEETCPKCRVNMLVPATLPSLTFLKLKGPKGPATHVWVIPPPCETGAWEKLGFLEISETAREEIFLS